MPLPGGNRVALGRRGSYDAADRTLVSAEIAGRIVPDKEGSCGLQFFAYGSLVNLTTISADVQSRRAKAVGWMRQWRDPREVDSGPICGLTISAAGDNAIEGVLLQGNPDFAAELRAREADDLAANIDVTLEDGTIVRAQTYVVPPSRARWADASCPICLSYLDCILQGYLAQFGLQGVRRFIETTEGWHLPLVNDRTAPRYPRPVKLSIEERSALDDCLSRQGLL